MAPDPGLLAAASLFLAAAAAAELAVPHLTAAAVASAAAHGAGPELTRDAARLAGAALAFGVCAALRGFLFSLLNTRLLHHLRGQLFDALVSAPAGAHDGGSADGSAASRLGADCHAVARCVSTNLNVAARNALAATGGAVYLIAASPDAAAACGAVGAGLALAALIYGRYSRAASRAYQDRLADASAVAEDALARAATVRALGGEAAERARYGAVLDRLRAVAHRQSAAYLGYVATNATLFNLSKAAALLAAGGAVASRAGGGTTVAALTATLLYVDATASSLLSLCDQWGAVSEALGAADRVAAYLDQPRAPQLDAGAVPASGVADGIVLEDVWYTYPSRPDAPALRGVSLTLPRGKRIALVGGSGSGKSTLVQCVLRMRDPDEGRVLVGELDARAVDAAWFRSRIALVEQEPKLFAGTVADNIAYAIDVPRESVVAAARAANAHSFIRMLPQGYDTRVTDRLLSGGQRQRIALARAFARDPDLLVLDEATSALDAESEAAVQAGLAAILADTSRPRSVLVIAHRLATVRGADEIVVMDHGRVAERGSHDELVARRGAYASLVARQMGGDASSLDLAPHQKDSTRRREPVKAAAAGKPADRAAPDAPETPGGGGDLLPSSGAGGGASTFDAKAKR